MNMFWIGKWNSDVLCDQKWGNIATSLRKLKNEISTIIIGHEHSWKPGGFNNIYYINPPKTIISKIFSEISTLFYVLRYRGDVLLLGHRVAYLTIFAAIIRKIFRKKWILVLDIRTLPTPSGKKHRLNLSEYFFWKSLKISFNYIDAWMAITPRLRDFIETKIDTKGLECAVWESAVDNSFIFNKKCPPSLPIKKRNDNINIIYIGSLARGRRLDLPIRAMSHIKDQNISLHMVGTGDHIAELGSLIDDLKLQNFVYLWDPVPHSDIPALLSACDLGILVLPDHEAWNSSSPQKIFEYLASGLPVLVSDIPAHRELLGDKEFSFTMVEYTEKAFLDSLFRFCSLSNDQRQFLAQQAIKFVTDNHTWDHRASVINSFLEKIRVKKQL